MAILLFFLLWFWLDSFFWALIFITLIMLMTD